MSLLPPPTTEQLQANLAINLGTMMNASFNQLVQGINTMVKQIWDNPKGLTPQQCWDSLGTTAASVRAMFLASEQFINGIKPGTITFVEPPLTVNNDGTITVL